MTKTVAVILLSCGGLSLLAAQTPPSEYNVLLRSYREGEKLTYRMKGINEDWHYEIRADGIVKKDSDGTYFEEYGWSDLISDKQKVVLSPASLGFRQQLTLDPKRNPGFPNLSQVDPKLIGPITDLMAFYSHLWLSVQTDNRGHCGDHVYFKHSCR